MHFKLLLLQRTYPRPDFSWSLRFRAEKLWIFLSWLHVVFIYWNISSYLVCRGSLLWLVALNATSSNHALSAFMILQPCKLSYRRKIILKKRIPSIPLWQLPSLCHSISCKGLHFLFRFPLGNLHPPDLLCLVVKSSFGQRIPWAL